MVIDSSSSLVAVLRAEELLDAEQLARVEGELQGRFPVPLDLGRQLLQLDWLTAYQVNQLLRGEGAALSIGPYHLLERLGAGGMGEVFKARHRRLHRVVALKVIRKERLAQANIFQRFLREARAAAQVSHPNVVAVYDADRVVDACYLAMELLEGIDLGRLVAQAGPLPVALACEYARQAALGLQHAHQAGLVHRDVKPQNLFLAASSRGKPRPPGPARHEDFPGGTIKLLDLGLVRLQGGAWESSEGALTQNGTVIGTVDYLAPEQAKNASAAGPRSDLYSLGCTLYFLLAGQPPFSSGQPLERLIKHQFTAPPPITGHRPDVPPAVAALLDRLLAKRPEDRFAGAREVVEALAGLPPGPVQPPSAALPVAPTDLPTSSESFGWVGPTALLDRGPRAARPPAAGKGGRRRRWWVAGGVAVAAGLVLFLGILALRRPAATSGTPRGSTPPSKGAPRPSPAPPEAPADYLPVDCAGAVGIDFRQLRRGPLLGKRPGGAPLGAEALGGLDLLGMAPDDLSSVRILLRAKKADRPVLDVRGKVVLERFRRGRWAIQEAPPGPGQPFFLFKYIDFFSGRTTWIGPQAPHYLVACADRAVVVEALQHAEQPTPSKAPVRPLLARVNRKQALWLALDLERLGPLALPEPLPELFGPVLSHTARLHGGVADGPKPRARFVFEAKDEGQAERVEEGLRALVDKVADGGSSTDPEEKALLRMLGMATVTRQGQVVTVEWALRPAPWR